VYTHPPLPLEQKSSRSGSAYVSQNPRTSLHEHSADTTHRLHTNETWATGFCLYDLDPYWDNEDSENWVRHHASLGVVALTKLKYFAALRNPKKINFDKKFHLYETAFLNSL
jgi:hypothetical protein